jgi:hypothetical protein
MVPAASPLLETAFCASVVRSDSAGLEILGFLLLVILLGHDLEILLFIFGLRIQVQEGLCKLLSLKLHKHTAFERLLIVAPQPDSLGRAIGIKERFDVKLSAGSLLAESLDVDGARIGSSGNSLEVVVGERMLASHSRVILRELDLVGILEGVDDGFKGLESLHAFEAVQLLERHGLVLQTSGQAEQVLVFGQIRIGEVEVDLCKFDELLELVRERE